MNHPSKRIYKLKEIVRAYGMSRSTIYRSIKNGLFPRQIKLTGGIDGHGASGWDADSIEAWYADRLSQANQEGNKKHQSIAQSKRGGE